MPQYIVRNVPEDDYRRFLAKAEADGWIPRDLMVQFMRDYAAGRVRLSAGPPRPRSQGEPWNVGDAPTRAGDVVIDYYPAIHAYQVWTVRTDRQQDAGAWPVDRVHTLEEATAHARLIAPSGQIYVMRHGPNGREKWRPVA